MSGRLISATLLVAVLAGTAGCGSGADRGSASRTTSTAGSSASPAALAVESTIEDGATLSAALPWEASVSVDAPDTVSSVDFVVDGEVRWTEHNEPFVFDDDGQLLAPWLLGAGAHDLSVHAVARSGAEGTTVAHVTVPAADPAAAPLAGTYRRTVTDADAKRVESYRTADKGAFGDVPAPGEWTMDISKSGLVEIRDPVHPDAPFEEPFTVTGDHLRLYGPAVWVQPDPTQPNLFCEPEKPSDYTWHLSGTTLRLEAEQKVCADRDVVVVGVWTRSQG